jgi:hypothetical protein
LCIVIITVVKRKINKIGTATRDFITLPRRAISILFARDFSQWNLACRERDLIGQSLAGAARI